MKSSQQCDLPQARSAEGKYTGKKIPLNQRGRIRGKSLYLVKTRAQGGRHNNWPKLREIGGMIGLVLL
jgi:hypothetical protein